MAIRDCAFVSAARLTAALPGSDGFFSGPPDLAVEVISPSDACSEVEEKVAEWLEAGCQAVLLVDPRRRTAGVHRHGQPVVPFGETDTLTMSDLLPGWSVSLDEVFRQPGQGSVDAEGDRRVDPERSRRVISRSEGKRVEAPRGVWLVPVRQLTSSDWSFTLVI